MENKENNNLTEDNNGDIKEEDINKQVVVADSNTTMEEENNELVKEVISKDKPEGIVYPVVTKPNLFKRFIKRSFDIFSSGLAIIILLPFFLLFTPIVAIKMKGNPFFIQKRPGKNGKIFSLIKYRTMTNAKDSEGNLLPDEYRMTDFGEFMRRVSIDELPELFNIFIGEMSVVGPRPLLVQYLPLYNDYQAQRHIVRPGLTGLAQVSGRNAISWEQKFDRDIEYIQNMSFWYDLKIIFMTVGKVFKREGISQEGEATMTEFKGNNIEG